MRVSARRSRHFLRTHVAKLIKKSAPDSTMHADSQAMRRSSILGALARAFRQRVARFIFSHKLGLCGIRRPSDETSSAAGWAADLRAGDGACDGGNLARALGFTRCMQRRIRHGVSWDATEAPGPRLGAEGRLFLPFFREFGVALGIVATERIWRGIGDCRDGGASAGAATRWKAAFHRIGAEARDSRGACDGSVCAGAATRRKADCAVLFFTEFDAEPWDSRGGHVCAGRAGGFDAEPWGCDGEFGAELWGLAADLGMAPSGLTGGWGATVVLDVRRYTHVYSYGSQPAARYGYTQRKMKEGAGWRNGGYKGQATALEYAMRMRFGFVCKTREKVAELQPAATAEWCRRARIVFPGYLNGAKNERKVEYLLLVENINPNLFLKKPEMRYVVAFQIAGARQKCSEKEKSLKEIASSAHGPNMRSLRSGQPQCQTTRSFPLPNFFLIQCAWARGKRSQGSERKAYIL
ncbi:hypothetical protein B0H17DRAFT_1149064 [Mycena rosella]|uniref:Uncharacterized protein n=1 Tax=Mycena rosella TaxID=1033263 RepID=A0AAD7C681_MYCRO|nr:hypothetical protein B0H17DRAFT_1149064 [Mycena rosella]